MLTMLSKRRGEKESAFTLIELLVVMIIIAILMAVAVPTFLKQKQKAVLTQATSNIKQIQTAMESCSTDSPTGSYANCNTAALTAAEPALANIAAPTTWSISGNNATAYVINYKNDAATYTETHDTAGKITRACVAAANQDVTKVCGTNEANGNSHGW